MTIYTQTILKISTYIQHILLQTLMCCVQFTSKLQEYCKKFVSNSRITKRIINTYNNLAKLNIINALLED